MGFPDSVAARKSGFPARNQTIRVGLESLTYIGGAQSRNFIQRFHILAEPGGRRQRPKRTLRSLSHPTVRFGLLADRSGAG